MMNWRIVLGTSGARPGDHRNISGETEMLNQFVAVSLEYAQQQLREEGRVKGTVNFAYGIGGDGEHSISQYELTRQDTDAAAQEIEEIRNYARKTGAGAVSVAMETENALVVAAVSPHGQITVMRPYVKRGDVFVFGDPHIVDRVPIPLLRDMFAPSKM